MAGGGGGGATPHLPGLGLDVHTGARRCYPFPSWKAPQKADYVLTTRGTTLLSPAPLDIGVVAGTPSKGSGRLTEAQVEQKQQRHQTAVSYHRTSRFAISLAHFEVGNLDHLVRRPPAEHADFRLVL